MQHASSGPEEQIRASIVDGIFYPSRRKELAALVNQLWEESDVPPGRAGGIISPHAAYQYSGGVAAAAFRAVSARRIETAVILGPIHRDPTNEIALPESASFQTPLGTVPVQQEIVEELLDCGTRFCRNDIPHLEEHCLEVQLPFLQFMFPRVEIVPILMGTPSLANVRLLAQSLKLVLAGVLPSTLVVVSANMSSYLQPVSSPDEIDLLLDLITRRDWQGVVEAAERGRISTCGSGCIATLLALSDLLGEEVQILQRRSSAEVAKREQTVVHYAAVALKHPEG